MAFEVPPALEERLGDEATAGLLELLHDTRNEWAAGVTSVVSDRFERRLMEENARLRVDMAQGFAAVRLELAQQIAAVRHEMAAGFASLRQEMADQRFELLKWAFLFWVGQFFAVATLIGVLVRFLRPGT